MPLALVSATAVASKSGVYLFGGVSQEIDLTGPELNFLKYDEDTGKWDFVVHFAMKSPFLNSRLLQPNILSLGDEVFLFFQKTQGKYVLQIFELKMGGFSLKFEEKGKRNSEVGIQGETGPERLLQNEQSLCFNAGVLYNLEEKTKSLFIWDIKDFEKTEVQCVEAKGLNESDWEFKNFENKALNP